ncbi:hypothetical protein [Propionivibrio sp.]|uniref:hypothetical protein n=1 Tax=Propionivibrio sp. TaxID=2212460 RepID=UPI0025EDEA6D|nr:hypothetical protein [Propionivibrio sp.]MBK7356158.1 hypothetical protein [Propionivibrio sp.]
MLGSMSKSLVANAAPEEVELFRKLKEVELLEDELVQRELDLCNPKAKKSKRLEAVTSTLSATYLLSWTLLSIRQQS